MSKTRMTHRIVRALQHPGVHILGHPTGRLIGKRDPYPVDMAEVIKAARDYGVLLERSTRSPIATETGKTQRGREGVHDG